MIQYCLFCKYPLLYYDFVTVKYLLRQIGICVFIIVYHNYNDKLSKRIGNYISCCFCRTWFYKSIWKTWSHLIVLASTDCASMLSVLVQYSMHLPDSIHSLFIGKKDEEMRIRILIFVAIIIIVLGIIASIICTYCIFCGSKNLTLFSHRSRTYSTLCCS